jgi:hypothetical protein
MKLQLTVLMLVASFALPTVAEDKKQPAIDLEAAAKLFAEIGTPGEAHQKLEPLAGKWTYTSKMWMDPSAPPMEGKGTCERKWILGGRFLEENIKGTGPGGSDFEARGTIGYDNVTKKYSYNWLCSMSTGSATGVGSFDKAGKQLSFVTEAFCPLQQKQVTMRDEINIISNDKHTSTTYQNVDGHEAKMMEVIAERVK